MSERNEIDIAKLAQQFSRLAETVVTAGEILMECANTLRALSAANVNLRTGRKAHRAHEPRLDPVTPGIQTALDSANRVRVARRRTGT